MPRGGKRDGAGRKPHPELPAMPVGEHPGPTTAADRSCAARLLEALNREASPEDSYEIKEWRKITEAVDVRVRFDARKYLYDKRDGKAIQPIDVDASVSGNFTVIMDLPAKKPRDGR